MYRYIGTNDRDDDGYDDDVCSACVIARAGEENNNKKVNGFLRYINPLSRLKIHDRETL